ncbi:MAG: cytochrome C oxidase subunit IV family protein [Clostridiales bacterium]|nr:cytochrome C oxidase subunit IV family protein [Clostridiales bacterium]
MRSYVLAWLSMLALSALVFLAVGMGWPPRGYFLAGVLGSAAILQVLIQLYVFMHLKEGQGWYPAYFYTGIGFSVLWVLGVWYLVWQIGYLAGRI